MITTNFFYSIDKLSKRTKIRCTDITIMLLVRYFNELNLLINYETIYKNKLLIYQKGIIFKSVERTIREKYIIAEYYRGLFLSEMGKEILMQLDLIFENRIALTNEYLSKKKPNNLIITKKKQKKI